VRSGTGRIAAGLHHYLEQPPVLVRDCGRLVLIPRRETGAIRRSSMIELKSRRHSADDLGSAIELCYAKGWTDGLPVIPPTAESIAAMLEAGGLKPDQQLAFIENRQVSVTAEKVAINAVMAGCKPEYMR
jgi:hypothetical protein